MIDVPLHAPFFLMQQHHKVHFYEREWTQQQTNLFIFRQHLSRLQLFNYLLVLEPPDII